MYCWVLVLVALFNVQSASGKLPDAELSSMSFKQTPDGIHEGLKTFFFSVEKSVKLSPTKSASLRTARNDAEPNVPLPESTDYVERIPQVSAADAYLEKELFIGNSECHIAYEKYTKPTKYQSHVVGLDQCYLSTFSTDLADPATFVYIKSTYKSVMSAEAGPSYVLESQLYQDSACSKKVESAGYTTYTDVIPKDCAKRAEGNSVVATKLEDAPARNLKLNKGTSVSLFASVDDCVAGTGSLQERMSREDNCYNGMAFECVHGDRFSEFSYKMTKYPNADCTETKLREEDPSKITTTHFTRAQGCANVMPLDSTVGHPMINCGQHW